MVLKSSIVFTLLACAVSSALAKKQPDAGDVKGKMVAREEPIDVHAGDVVEVGVDGAIDIDALGSNVVNVDDPAAGIVDEVVGAPN
ncbi:uncharacterized protein BX664DRAFT_330261 [Halteromyces radiatus]|uniref:uncharacterized protein n=1 Tax=Halteromyces radiatus TaxID=101107 RepID=UPI0022209603|nr:uncharacterized protein BX664DRAFT_330261 [Halteromyces radiatus]KAI8093659.1 hypothetical protein BX664DRAFT_330261 [Halteromyces radiatus]